MKRPIAFVIGMAAATTILGVIAASAGEVIGRFGAGFHYAIAAVPLIMGLHLVGWFRLPLGNLPHRVVQNGFLSTFGAGFLLAVALSPCGTPVLASVLSYVAYKGSVSRGAILLGLYGVGSAIPVVLVGAGAGHLTARLEKAGYGVWAERISGTALMALGFLLVWQV